LRNVFVVKFQEDTRQIRTPCLIEQSR
jgi:hypothetical protein